MKLFSIIAMWFVSSATALSAPIGIVDNAGAPWLGYTTGVMKMSETTTVSPGADVLVVNVMTYGNASWTNFTLSVSGTNLTMATQDIGRSDPLGHAVDTAIFYLDNPPVGTITLSGTLGSASDAMLNHFTLGGVNPSIPPVVGSANAGASAVGSITLTSSGGFADICQAEGYGAGPTSGYYFASHGNGGSFNFGVVQNLKAGDGFTTNVPSGSDTFTAGFSVNGSGVHPISAIVFSGTSTAQLPQWVNGGDNWSNPFHWSTGTVPNGAGQAVLLNNANASEPEPVTITLDQPATVGAIAFGNETFGNEGFMLTGTNTLTLDNSGSNATIISTQGHHAITMPMVLPMPLDVTGNANTQLILENEISAQEVSMSGAGTLILAGTNAFNAVTVDSGTVIMNDSSAISDGSSLTVGAGGVFIFDPTFSAATNAGAASQATVAAVPEPGTLVLAATFAMCLLTWRRARQCS